MICKNCGNECHENYCPRCGQKTSVSRLSSSSLMHNIILGWINCDQGILYTIKELYTRPGGMITDYLDGKRVRYFAPFQMLFVVAAISLFMYSLLGIREDVIKHFPQNDITSFSIRLFQFLFNYTALINVMFIPFTGAFYRWLYGKSFRRRYNWIETFFIVAYVQVQRDILWLVLLPMYWVLGEAGLNLLAFAMTILLGTWCFRGLTCKSWWGNIWRVSVVNALYFVLLMLIIFIISFVFIITHWI